MKSVLVLFMSVSVGQGVKAYEGSSFNEVLSILGNNQAGVKSQQEKAELLVYLDGRLPSYPVNAKSVFSSATTLVKDAQRTVNEKYDYYDYLPKKLHPNGVCVVGEWHIKNSSPYSGYFSSGARGLFIGRISVAMEKVSRGEKRGFGFAGKIFPTLNPDEVVKTANFFTLDVLLGTKIEKFFDTRMTNQPDTGFDLSLLGLGLKISSALKEADEDPTFRPVTPVAKLGESGSVTSPRWMRLSPNSSMVKNDQSDFRNEVLKAVQDNREISFSIESSGQSGDRDSDAWLRLGEITIRQALVGYGCDRRLHFAHPKAAE